jgi:hypothetical protein
MPTTLLLRPRRRRLRGPHAVQEPPRSHRRLAWARHSDRFVTATLPGRPGTVARHLVELGIGAAPADVVTSAQAVARLMAGRLPRGAAVLVAGTEALAAEVR